MSRPYKCPTYKYPRFVGTAQSPATPTNVPRIKNCSPFFVLGSLTPTREKRRGDLGHLSKIVLLKGEGFGLKSFGAEVVDGKKMLFYIFFKF